MANPRTPDYTTDGHPHQRDETGFCTTCGAVRHEYHYRCIPKESTMEHPAAEAPQTITDSEGITRPETEQERITRIQTAMQSMEDRAYRKPLPGSIDLAAYLGKSDFRPGDIVDVHQHDKPLRTAEVSGRDNENIYVRYHDTNTQNRVHYTALTMIQHGIGHGDAPVLITPPADLPTRKDPYAEHAGEPGILAPTRAEAAAEFAEAIIGTPLRDTGYNIVTPSEDGDTTTHDDAVAHLKSIEQAEEQIATVGLGVDIQLLHSDAQVPEQARAGDAGYDLHTIEAFSISANGRRLIGTGVSVAIPIGYVGFIKPRSGLAAKHGMDVLGGVIDAGYRGEVKVILHNTGGHPVAFDVGDRIAQLVVQPVAAIGFRLVDRLDDSERSQHGFGSTGQ